MSSSDNQKSEDQISEKIKSELVEKLKAANLTRRQRNEIYRILKQSDYTKAVRDFTTLAAVFLSTPLGQWLLTVVILEMLAKAKFFSQISVDILIGVVTSGEIIGAISGGQGGLLGEIAGLASLFK